MRHRVFFCAIALLAGVSTSAAAQLVVTFDDLTVGTKNRLGDTFTSCGVDMTVTRFSASSVTGNTVVAPAWFAMRSGLEIGLGNVSLSFDFAQINGVTLYYGEYGGPFGIDVNGQTRRFNDLAEADGQTIGGVYVSSPTPQPLPFLSLGSYGSITLDGPISSFAIGGYRLFLDDVAVVPEPSGIIALNGLFGDLGFAFVKRRLNG